MSADRGFAEVLYSATMPVHTSAVVAMYVVGRQHELAVPTLLSLNYNLQSFAIAVGDPPARTLARAHVEHWMRTAKLAAATLRTRLSQLRCFCSWAVEHGYSRTDPTLGIRGPRQPRRLPRGLQLTEAQAIVAHAPDSRSRLIVLLMLQEGLRRREVAGLMVGDIDMSARTMLVIGKGLHERTLPISAETWAALVAYLGTGRVVAGPLVRSLKDGRSPIQPATIGRLVSALMLAAGVKQRPYDGRSGHSCRHTAATDTLRAGAHLLDVQHMLGHRSITSTEVYLPLIVNDLRTAMGGRRYGS